MAIVVALDTANVSIDGERYHVTRGEAWDGSDPLVKAHPDLFGDDPGALRRTVAPVEQATRAPGERRLTRRG